MAIKGGKMKDLIITVCRDTRKVKFNREFIGLTGENLQGNIVVDFEDKTDFVDGSALFEVEQNGAKYFIEMTKDADAKTYSLPIKSSLLQYACTMKCQVTITQEATNDGVPVFKTEIFKMPCNEAINAVETIPEQYPLWFDEVEKRLQALEENGGGGGNAEFENFKKEVEDAIGVELVEQENETVENLTLIAGERWKGVATPSKAGSRARTERIVRTDDMKTIRFGDGFLNAGIYGSNDGEILEVVNAIPLGEPVDISNCTYKYLYIDITLVDSSVPFPNPAPHGALSIVYSINGDIETVERLKPVKDLIGGSNKYKIIAGCIRRATESDSWGFIIDENHQCDLNCATVTINNRGNIVINYPEIKAKKVISVVAVADEGFAEAGITCGASVGKDLTNLYLYRSTINSAVDDIYGYDGNITFLNGTKGITSASWDFENKCLVVKHNVSGSLHDKIINVTPTTKYGQFIPRILSKGGDNFSVQFLNLDGTLIETPTYAINCRVSVTNINGIKREYIDANNLYSNSGNFWFVGVFETWE